MIVFGYFYVVFLGKDFVNVLGVDIDKGIINGVIVVMLGCWGSYVGVMDLILEK